ncbi:MAG: hypothetical protein Q9163_002380 [Psora crenata]
MKFQPSSLVNELPSEYISKQLGQMLSYHLGFKWPHYQSSVHSTSVLAHIGFISDVADALSQKLSRDPLKRARLHSEIVQIQKRLRPCNLENPSPALNDASALLLADHSNAPQAETAPSAHLNIPKPSDSAPSTSIESRPGYLKVNLPTTALQTEYLISNKRVGSLTGEDEPKKPTGPLHIIIGERIAHYVEEYSKEKQRRIRSIFSQAAFDNFTTLCDHARSNLNDLLGDHIDRSNMPRALPQFQETYLQLLRLRSIESTPPSPLRQYSLNWQFLQLYISKERLLRILRNDRKSTEAFLDVVSRPRETSTISSSMICQCLLKIDHAHRYIVRTQPEIESEISQLTQLMHKAQEYHVLTEEFGLGILALISTNWSWESE